MKLVARILLLFMIAQLLGIYTGMIVLTDIVSNPYVQDLIVTSNAADPANALFFMVYVLLGAVIMILLIKYFKIHPNLFKLLEFILVSTSSSIVFYAFLRLMHGYEISMLTGIAMGLIFSVLRFFLPSLKNTAAVLATAGVGVIFGMSLGLLPVVLFLILLAIYDYLSVFATKHMVELAEFVVQRDLAFTVTARAPPLKPGAKEQRIDLGTGDMIAPIMLEVSAMTFGLVAVIFVFAGATISMALFLTLVWRRKMVLPALPPIVLGMIVSLLIGFLLGAY